VVSDELCDDSTSDCDAIFERTYPKCKFIAANNPNPQKKKSFLDSDCGSRKGDKIVGEYMELFILTLITKISNFMYMQF
jgi:hypothetical protein